MTCSIVLLNCTLMLLGQSPTDDPPLTGRPPGFSNIVGRYDEPKVEASPTAVAVEEPITLRITITGTGPVKYEPRRENLHLFPAAWERDFYVEEMRDEHRADRDKKTWLFVYRLRPKHTKVSAIADIKLVYYNPNSSEKWETHIAESITITVKPRAEVETVVERKFVPESFYQSAPIEIERTLWTLALPHLVGFLAAPPLACLLGAWVWKRYRPDERESRRRLRSEAAAQALARLRAQAAPVWDTVGRYLCDRFDIDLAEPTPAEVSASLRRRGFAKDLCARGGALMQACDALRYGNAAAHATLAEDAAGLIAALEADPCAR